MTLTFFLFSVDTRNYFFGKLPILTLLEETLVDPLPCPADPDGGRESPWGLIENYRFLGSHSAELEETDLEWLPGSSLLGKILRGL